MLDQIKSFGFVSLTGEYLSTIPCEVTNGLHSKPGTHGGRAASLVAELEIMEAYAVLVSKSQPSACSRVGPF